MSQIVTIQGALVRESDGTVTIELRLSAWQPDGTIREVPLTRTLTNAQWNAIKTGAAGALLDPPTR
jgi:hypothetical protein